MRLLRFHLLMIGISLLTTQVCGQTNSDIRNITISQGTNLSIAVDPKEQFIIHDLQGALYKMDINGGSSKPITGYYMDARQPNVSSDGSTVYFQSYQDGNWHIWSVRTDGSELRQLTSGQYDYREPAVHNLKNTLAYSSDRSGSYDIWTISSDGTEQIQLTDSKYNDYGPTFSHDGRHLAFVRETPDGWQLNSIDLEQNDITTLYESAHKLYAPAWDYDDRSISFVAHDWLRSSIKQVKLDSNRVRTLTEEDEDVFPFRVQHFKHAAYYTADGKIKVARSDGSIESIPFTVELPVHVGTYEQKSPKLNIAEPQQIKGIHGPKISPDGSKVCFVALGDVWVKDLRTESLTRVTHDRYVQLMPSWHPDGKQIIYASDKNNDNALWIYSLYEETHRQVGVIGVMPSGISVHPDGHSIAYTMAFGPRSGRLSIMDLASGQSTSPRSNFPFSTSSPSWHPEGDRILLSILQPYSGLYREGIARNIVVDVSTGETSSHKAATHLSFGARTNDPPLIIDDAKKLIYVSEGQLHEVHLDTNMNVIDNPRTIISSLVDAPSIDANDRYLSYMSGAQLMLHDRHSNSSSTIDINLNYGQAINTPKMVIHAGTIITMDGRRLTNHDIVIHNHKIASIIPHQEWDSDIHLIDASEQYIIPGLIDMHAHQGSDLGTSLGYKWLSWGVTSTRDPATYPYDAQNRKEAQINGDILHPRIFYTGSPIDGNRVYYNGTYAQMSLEQIQRELTRSQDLDYDLIKTYVRLPDSLQRAVVKYAHDHGLPVTSHELYPAALMGIDGVEHILGTSRRGYTPKMSLTYKNYEDVAKVITSAGMTFTPTIGIYSGYNYMLHKHPELIDDTRLQRLESDYALAGARAGILTVDKAKDDYKIMFKRQASLIKNIYDQGGIIIAGTDSPILPYGFGYYTELLCYQEAGLDPYVVLQTATTNAAEALNVADQIGSIKEGMLADMLILDQDPTADIYNLKSIDKIILSGRVMNLEDLLTEYSSSED